MAAWSRAASKNRTVVTLVTVAESLLNPTNGPHTLQVNNKLTIGEMRSNNVDELSG
jgi:hypothetical protein